MRPKSKVKKMYILDGGNFLYGMSFIKFGHQPQVNVDDRIRVPTPFYAFETEEGWIMYDTGWVMDFVPYLAQMGSEPAITEENTPAGQLKKIGVSPSEVKKIILSHVHPDHSGGLGAFSEAQVYVQKDEYAFGCYPNSFMAGGVKGSPLDKPGLAWELLDGDELIMPGLTVVRANGHSPGLQALVVELPESGFFVLTGDAAYTQENIDNDLPPGLGWNPVFAQYSIKRLKALAGLLDAQLLPGHDPETFAKFKYCEAYV